MSSETWELRIPQNELGFKFLLVAVKSQPICVSHVAQFVTLHAYLQGQQIQHIVCEIHEI